MSKWLGNKLSFELSGTSHSDKISIKVHGLPHIKIDEKALLAFMTKRQGGQGNGTTPRKETDIPFFIKGVKDSTIINDDVEIVIYNNNINSSDYNDLYGKPRPSHADYVSYVKEGTLDYRGGGRFSGRLTALIVTLGGILKQYFKTMNIFSTAYVSSVGRVNGFSYKYQNYNMNNFDSNGLTSEMIDEIKNAVMCHDSVGARVECIISGVKAGIGNDYFEGLEGKIASLIYGIPGVKGVEFGSGFDFTKMYGSKANDGLYYDNNGNVRTYTNNAGGINGGITNGNDITLAVAFRPTPSINKEQKTIDIINKCNTTIKIKGRHDGCIAIRAIPVVESVTYIALYDEIN